MINCSPKKLRENQTNCSFYLYIVNGSYNVHQFDVKGDKDKYYSFSEKDFYLNWNIF